MWLMAMWCSKTSVSCLKDLVSELFGKRFSYRACEGRQLVEWLDVSLPVIFVLVTSWSPQLKWESSSRNPQVGVLKWESSSGCSQVGFLKSESSNPQSEFKYSVQVQVQAFHWNIQTCSSYTWRLRIQIICSFNTIGPVARWRSQSFTFDIDPADIKMCTEQNLTIVLSTNLSVIICKGVIKLGRSFPVNMKSLIKKSLKFIMQIPALRSILS